jgi:hypothetical protein
MIATTPSAALAGGSSGCGCKTAPPPPPPPKSCNCDHDHGHGHGGAPPSLNLNVTTKVNVTVNASASASSSASSRAGASAFGAAQGQSFSGGNGGGGSSGVIPGSVSAVNLSVGGEDSEAYEAERTRIEKVVIQAFCFDDKDVPHPASQVFPDRDVEDSYDGEVYRCIAGTRLQYTWAEFNGQVAFDHGTTVTCQKGDALYHIPGMPGAGGPNGAAGGGEGARLECRPQKPARDCNERSLLRRFGAGVKVLTMITVEKYTAYREETTSATTTTALSLDGGVGGVMY